MKKRLLLITAFILCICLCGCGQKKNLSESNDNDSDTLIEKIDEDNQIVNISLSQYITSYNNALRETVKKEAVYKASDAEYISCAKTLIEAMMKNPSTAKYNSATVSEKDSYGRAIVALDVSAQNSFGGWV